MKRLLPLLFTICILLCGCTLDYDFNDASNEFGLSEFSNAEIDKTFPDIENDCSSTDSLANVQSSIVSQESYHSSSEEFSQTSAPQISSSFVQSSTISTPHTSSSSVQSSTISTPHTSSSSAQSSTISTPQISSGSVQSSTISTPQISSTKTPSSNGNGVSVPSQAETQGNLVWVPTMGGTKYHSRSSCSGMKNPIQVSIETAKANGYTACKRCH